MKKRHNEERSKFTALENHFLNTFFSGLYLSQSDFIHVARSVGITMAMNSREMLIKQLLNDSDKKGVLPQAMAALNAIIDDRINEYHKLSLDYPAARDVMAKLAQKASGTKALLARESKGSPYDN